MTFTVRALPVASYDTESERDLFALYCDNYEGLRVSDCRDPTVLELLKVGTICNTVWHVYTLRPKFVTKA